MSIEEIINVIERLADGAEACSIAHMEPEAEQKIHENSAKALREAIALLKTHPEAQPNQPLTLEELREAHTKPAWLDCKYEKGWGIVGVYEYGNMVSITTLNDTYFIYTRGEYNELLGARLYRRPRRRTLN